MRSDFRAALMHVLTSGVDLHKNMWVAYKEHLRDIAPEDVPLKVREKFIELKNIAESRVGAIVQYAWDRELHRQNTPKPNAHPNYWKFAPKKTFEEIKEEVEDFGLYYRRGPFVNMSGPIAASFRRLLFEIVEDYPKGKKHV